MSFALFIIYILCTYLRPFETIALDLAPYRPMLVLWAAAFVTVGVRALMRSEVAARPVHFGLLGALIVTVALSQVANQWVGGALPAVADFSTAAMLTVLCLLNLTSLRRLQAACIAIAFSVVVLAGLSTYSFHTGFMAEELVMRQSVGDDVEFDSLEMSESSVPAEDKSGLVRLRIRSFGFLNDPNDFAQAMVMALPLLWWFYAPGRWLRNVLVVFVPALLLGYATYLTQSRGALLGVAVLGLLASLRRAGPSRTFVGATLLALLLAASASILSFGGREFSTKEESAAGRIDAWQEGITMLRGKPLFGVGYGNFTDHNPLTAHNSFVLCFAELGLVGYFLWMGLIVLSYKGLQQALRWAPDNAPETRLVIALRASLAGYIACAWFLSRAYSPGLFLLLALCVASWHCVRQVYRPPSQSVLEEPLPWRMLTLVAMVVSIAAVYAFVLVQRQAG